MVRPGGRLVLGSFLLASTAQCYHDGDAVPVSVNKVWPESNPMETYAYYQILPFCHPGRVQAQSMTFGQLMRGDRLVNSIYQIQFKRDKLSAVVCSRTMSESDRRSFRSAIDQRYMFEIYVDDLPIVRPIGIVDIGPDGKVRHLLGTSMDFVLGYNEGQVVSANMTIDAMSDISEGTDKVSVEFNYSVRWEESAVSAHSKLQSQLKGAFMPKTHSIDIHWLAIINSFVLVLFIASLLLLIVLRVVKSDLSKYLRIPDEEIAAGGEDEVGWKLLRADVFRPPPHRMWFSACIGSGAHLLLVAVTIVLIGCFSPYVERGTFISFALFGYMLTSYIAGYISANFYRRLGGDKWAWNIVITALMFVLPLFGVWSLLNTVAIVYSSTAALPFTTAALIFAIWSFVTLPLTILGGIVGRQRAAKRMELGTPFPCKANKLAREIPSVYWYQSPWIQVLISGFLPFSAIYIELHFIFMSVWDTYVYTLYGVLLLAVILLLLVAATVSILLTYFHLNAEDHRWWWRSFFSGGSVALFFYVHCAHYFFTSTRMYGILQVAFFFGYSLLVAWGIFLMMGFITFSSTYIFVHGIYSSIKSD